MRFAQWVLDQIKTNGYKISNSYEENYYVNHDRKFMTDAWSDFACSSKQRDDWNLYICDGWIFKDVRLFRGPENHRIDLTKDEIKQFLKFDRNRLAAIKLKNKEEARAEMQRQIQAQDWP